MDLNYFLVVVIEHQVGGLELQLMGDWICHRKYVCVSSLWQLAVVIIIFQLAKSYEVMERNDTAGLSLVLTHVGMPGCREGQAVQPLAHHLYAQLKLRGACKTKRREGGGGLNA